MSPCTLTIHEAQAKLSARELSAVELTRAVLDRIRATDDRLHAYLHVCADDALSQAEAADRTLAAGAPPSPLCGIPIALKDVILTRGIRSTAGSKILENFIPPYDATVTRKLRDAGAVIVGKANCDEFAMGSSNENSAYAACRNPWDSDRVPGGSSGGSAAAVAADQACASLGTDTGGSIRLPAAFCGVVGLKPSYGRVSRFGVVAYASSLDQVGPVTKDVRDCALLLQTIAGHDPHDSTSVDVPVPDYTAKLDAGVRGLRVGLPREYFIDEMPNQEFNRRLAQAQADGKITADQARQLDRADYIVYGRQRADDAEVYFVAEVSWTLGRDDITRARERADIMAAASGVNTLAVAVAQEIPPPQVEPAAAAAVMLIQDDGN